MYIVIVCLCYFVLAVQGKCNGGCSTPLKHYEEFGCEPVYTKSDDCCPAYYNCLTIKGRSKDKCYYKGQVYDKGDTIDSSLTSPNCLASCFCSKTNEQEFTCAHIDCPEFFGVPLKPGCYRAYDHDNCCSTKTVCPPFDKLAKCEVDGKTYYDGQRFETPSEKKLSCLCKPDFKGEFTEPFCKPINCGMELTRGNLISQKCAPVYYGNDGVCPIDWQCEDNLESVQIAKQRSSVDKKCKFGSKELNVGDKLIMKRFSEHSPEIKCECRIPPVATCIQTPHN